MKAEAATQPRIDPARIKHFSAALMANPPRVHRNQLNRWRNGKTAPTIAVLLDRPDLLEALLNDYRAAHAADTTTDAEAVPPAPAS